jgi:NAD(P)-dependent dehydrogenase (short-subunit alcohol dehydrogenase family)
MPTTQFDVGLNLESTHVLITGGAGLIGRAVVSAFLAAGACVTSLDIAYPSLSGEFSDHLDSFTKFHPELGSFQDNQDSAQSPWQLKLLPMHADTTDGEQLETAWSGAVKNFGPVQCCIALAAKDLSVLRHVGVTDMEPQQWMDTLRVNVGGPMLTARQWLRGLRAAQGKELAGKENINLIMVGSESGWFGERTNPDYAASKAAVQVGLLQSLKAEAPRIFEGARYLHFLRHFSQLSSL